MEQIYLRIIEYPSCVSLGYSRSCQSVEEVFPVLPLEKYKAFLLASIKNSINVVPEGDSCIWESLVKVERVARERAKSGKQQWVVVISDGRDSREV